MSERITIKTPVKFNDPVPASADVVVIGGGVIGVFTALNLARAGKRVMLCEKGRIAGEQSSRNWGWIRQQGRDAAEMPIMMRALELWKETDRETGGACGVRTTGTLYLSSKPNAKDGFEDLLKTSQDHGVDTQLLTGRDVGKVVGHDASYPWARALYTESDARGEPWHAVPAVASLAQQSGASIREECAVRALDIVAGQVSGVVTESGTIKCDQVVLAAGAWSSLFARRHGVSIPQLTLRGTVARTAPMPQVFNCSACDEKLAFRRREDGGYSLALPDWNSFYLGPDAMRHARRYLPVMKSSWKTLSIGPAQPRNFPDAWQTPRTWAEDSVSPFEKTRVLEPAPDTRHLHKMRRRFAERFPRIGDIDLKTTWGGMIDVMPDVVPIVDRVPSLSCLVIATGMSGHGFGIGPGFGEILSKLVLGEPTGFDLTRFRFARFSDGSKLDIGPGL
jgi:glycine/D-amino acid oxidase-like deaminating enzyme